MRSIRSIVLIGVAVTAFTGVAAESSGAAVGGPPSWSWQYWTPTWNQSVFDKRIIKFLPAAAFKREPRKAAPTFSATAIARFPVRNMTMADYAEPVGNQGGVGSCTAWAVVYGMGGWWANKLHKLGYSGSDWFNPMSVYAPVGGYKDVGINLWTVADYATWGKAVPNGVGMTKASDYSVNEFDFTHHPTLGEKFAAIPFKFSNYRNLYSSDPDTDTSAVRNNKVNAIKNEINSGRPLVIAIRLHSDFVDSSWVNNSSAYSRRNGASDKVLGWHAMFVLGYDADGIRVENSWGTGWGDNGYKTLSWSYVKSDIRDATAADGLH
ncbi:MAG: C1 family peptidase [Solirubrobacterales bacterium]|nr:C1 family peptidase [Solirubrobacterales bacterium]